MNIVDKPEEITSTEATEIEKNAKLTDEELAYILEVKICQVDIYDKRWSRALMRILSCHQNRVLAPILLSRS